MPAVVRALRRIPSLDSESTCCQPRIPADDSVPHEVMRLQSKNNWSLICAWHEYLGVTQTEMATRLGIRQPSYAAMESIDAKPKKATRERIAAALGVSLEQVS